MNIFFNLVFFVFSIFILIKSIAYGLYEIKQEKNKFGGISVICFNFLVIILGNIIMWIK